jgi:hypothetical protein
MEEAIEESKVVYFIYEDENTTYENIVNALGQNKEVKLLIVDQEESVAICCNLLGEIGNVIIFGISAGSTSIIFAIDSNNEWTEN